jgi:pimeloyl-ACP methyl ester carboxylesterase
MPTVRCNGVDLHFVNTRQGTPLVLLPGLAGDHLAWMGQVRAFSDRFRCLALDLRDSGQSSYVDTVYSMADLADDVAALLDALQLPAAHVAGHSFGGMIAQEMALRHPGRVLSLFLLSTSGRADAWFTATLDAFGLVRRQVADAAEHFNALLQWLVSYRYFESPERLDWLRGLLRKVPHPQRIDGFFRQAAAIRQHNTLDRLPEIRCPVLVVVGEEDLVAPPRYARQLAERLPQARLEILPGVGHLPLIEDSRSINRLLAEFLP